MFEALHNAVVLMVVIPFDNFICGFQPLSIHPPVFPVPSVWPSSVIRIAQNMVLLRSMAYLKPFNKSSNLEIFERLFIAPLPTTPLMRSDAFPCHVITIDSVTTDPFSIVLIHKSRYL